MANRIRLQPPADIPKDSQLGRFLRQLCEDLNAEKHGNFPVGSHTSFDDNGFMVFSGGAIGWDDMQFQISSGRVSAANFPTWETFTTNTAEYSFAVDDYIDMGANEPPHGWKEGSDGSVHMHVTTKAANATGANRYAKFTVYIAYANVGAAWTETSLTAELTIPTGTAALHHFLLSVGTLQIPAAAIGMQIKVRVKRIAATGGTEYAGNIFITQLGDHLLKDTYVSRSVSEK